MYIATTRFVTHRMSPFGNVLSRCVLGHDSPGSSSNLRCLHCSSRQPFFFPVTLVCPATRTMFTRLPEHFFLFTASPHLASGGTRTSGVSMQPYRVHAVTVRAYLPRFQKWQHSLFLPISRFNFLHFTTGFTLCDPAPFSCRSFPSGQCPVPP